MQILCKKMYLIYIKRSRAASAKRSRTLSAQREILDRNETGNPTNRWILFYIFDIRNIYFRKAKYMEKELLHKLKLGDENTYQTVFNNYFPLLVAFANKYIQDLDLAKEIVQVVFVKLFEKRNSLEITTSIKSYLYKMVYNDCLNAINSQKITSRHYSQYARQIDIMADYLDVIEQTEKELRIFKAIEKLPPQCKLILQQSRFEGKKNKVIADELNISIRTVETQISKALKLLKAGINLFLF